MTFPLLDHDANGAVSPAEFCPIFQLLAVGEPSALRVLNPVDASATALPLASARHEGGTWWGNNQHKLVRAGGRVFTGVFDNAAPAAPEFVLFGWDDRYRTWAEGCRMPATTPGNLVFDHKSRSLHVFVHESTDPNNDAKRRLVHYKFAHVGDPVMVCTTS